MSKYPNVKSTEKNDIDILDYKIIVQKGMNQDLVLKARALKQKGDINGYKLLKSSSQVVTGSAVMNQGRKEAKNVNYLNGLIIIDIDEYINDELLNILQNDKYTFMLHRSFGGDGICIFVKINPEKFKESFDGLAQYYLSTYNVTVDMACSNPNRLRYISYDPHLFYNEKSQKYTAPRKKKQDIKESNIIYTRSDFDNILEQIKDKSLDLCQDDYQRYISIGFAMYDKFGAIEGLEHFKFICQFGSKYDPDKIEKHYKNFCKTGKITIATFYYYCLKEGIDIYTQDTKNTIQTVKIQKSQGTPTIESVSRHLKDVHKIEEPNQELIKELINSKVDYAKNIQSEDSEIAQIEKFIIDVYNPVCNELTNDVYINNKNRLDDKKLNDIYIAATKFFDFSVAKNDIRDIINSSSIKSFNPVKNYFKYLDESMSETKSDQFTELDDYINCVEPKINYNAWAFKKWAVGCIHNWLSNEQETLVSPLTLVLTGKKQGTGKTSFFRQLLPKELKMYLAETRIDLNNKDSMINMTKNLIVLDDEFGGIAIKEVKDFKKMADTNIIDMRLPYGSIYMKFKRRASLCGTSNEENILKDVTGNRRILPINVDKVNYDKIVSIDKDRLWYHAYLLYKEGLNWKIYNDEDVKYLNSNTQNNIDINPVEELFFKLYSITETSEQHICEVLNQGEILNYMSIHTAIKPTKYDIKDIFVKNNLVYKVNRVNGILKKGVILYRFLL